MVDIGAVLWKNIMVEKVVNIGLLITKKSQILREIGADLTKPLSSKIIKIKTIVLLWSH